MPSTAIKSQGATLGRGDAASPEVYTAIANIQSFNLSGVEANDIDVTDLSSTGKEFLQGLEDPGSVDITGFYDSANTSHQAIRDAVGGSTVTNYRVTLSDSSTITFAALVQSFALDIAVDGAVELSATLKISGGITYA